MFHFGPLLLETKSEESVISNNAKEENESIAARGNQASMTTYRLIFFVSKQKKKNYVPDKWQDNWNMQSNVNHYSNVRIAWKNQIYDCEVPSQNVGNDESFKTNIQGGTNDWEERSLPVTRLSMTHPSKNHDQ
jgi:hypothetical protein